MIPPPLNARLHNSFHKRIHVVCPSLRIFLTSNFTISLCLVIDGARTDVNLLCKLITMIWQLNNDDKKSVNGSDAEMNILEWKIG